MNKNKPILKALCAATIIALGSSAYAERVIVTHDASDNGLKKGHQVLVNGNGWFAVDLDENGKSAMRGKKGFKKMEADHIRVPLAMYNDTVGSPDITEVTPYGYFQSQADQLSLQAGQKVCVIDSGIAEMEGETGGYNEDFNWAEITGDSDPGTGYYNSDGGPHGTHVAGTIGAVKGNDIGVVGMAPGVPMHIIKVFNAAGWGYSSDLAKASDLCLAAEANIINMSLGGGGANSTEENAFKRFRDAGGLVLAAAGNDGNNVRSYPAGYESVMMVGAVDADNVIASFSQFPPTTTTTTTGKGKKRTTTTTTNEFIGVEISAGGVGTLSTVPSGNGSTSSLTADGVAYASAGMENQGSASGATFNFGLGDATDGGASGKICVIERGVISFQEKVDNCQNSGGIGAIVYNNEPGVVQGTLGTPNNTTIPAVGATQADGPALLAASNASVFVGSSNYDSFSGTSMATPTTAGVAALVWSNHPSCNGQEIRAALKASAEDKGATGRDDFYGYGIVKAKAASDYLTINGCGGSEPPPPPPSGDATLSGSRSKGNRQANLSWTTGLNGSNVDVFSNGSVIGSTPNSGSVSITVSKSSSYTFKVCETGTATCTNEITL